MDISEQERQAEQEIEHWLGHCVVGLNLCPFAKRPLRDGTIRIRACLDPSILESALFFRSELLRLLDDSVAFVETTLLGFSPETFESFDVFLDFIDELNAFLSENGLDEEIQLVGFHPEYLFEGEPVEARSHFTNRSPYPVVHLIRQASMTEAIQAYGEEKTDQIPEANMQTLEQLSEAEFKKLFSRTLS